MGQALIGVMHVLSLVEIVVSASPLNIRVYVLSGLQLVGLLLVHAWSLICSLLTHCSTSVMVSSHVVDLSKAHYYYYTASLRAGSSNFLLICPMH